MKKIGLFLFFVAVGAVSLLAQTRGNDTDSRQIREILNGGNFKINIQNVINNPKSTTAIYSKHSIEVVGDTIKADLPYFYRNDNPQAATETNVKIDTSIKKLSTPKQSKQGSTDLNITTAKPQYTIHISVRFDGYSIVTVKDKAGNTAFYNGRLDTGK